MNKPQSSYLRCGLALLAALWFAGVPGRPAWAQEPAPAAAPAAPAPAATATTEPLALADCIRLALSRNPSLVSSQQAVVSATAGLQQARSSYYPQLTLGASTGASGVAGSQGLSGTDRDASADLTLGLTFWRSGRRHSVNQSRASLDAAGAALSDDRLALAAQAADDYYAVLAAGELVGVAKAGVEYAQQHREQVQKQIDAGDLAAVEIHTVDADLASARQSLIEAQGTVRTAFATLKNDLALPYQTQVQLVPQAMGAEAETPALEEAVRTALQSRPDLQAQQARVRALEAAAKVAKTNRGPILEVSGQAVGAYNDDGGSGSSWNLLAGVSWPLADGGYTRAAESTARASLLTGQAALQTLSNQATAEVEKALIAVQTARENIAACEAAVTAARARLQSAEVKSREGLGITVEVTLARQSLTSAEADNVRARYDYQTALIALQQAMGTLPLPAPAAEGGAQ